MERLTARERDVLRLVAAGRSTKEVASELGIAFKTAACHRYRLLSKTGTANTADLVAYAVREGLLDVLEGQAGRASGHERKQGSSPACLETLTHREREVLSLVAAGRTTKEIAEQLGIAFKTAACHRYRLLSKAGAGNSAELVLLAAREEFLTAQDILRKHCEELMAASKDRTS